MSSAEYEAFRTRLDRAGISTYVLAMLSVGLKLWCRQKAGGVQNLGLDDLFSALALVAVNGLFWVIMIGLRPYLGKHALLEVLPADLNFYLRYTFAAQLLYILCIALLKLSMLSFYHRLFALKSRYIFHAFGFVVVSWFISCALVTTFACKPISAQWDVALLPIAKCADNRTIFLTFSTINILTDVLLIAMPLNYVWKLHAPIAQRIILIGMFALGIFVTIVSIIRLKVLVDSTGGSADITYTLKEPIYWSAIEVHIGMVCTCLPSLRPLIRTIGLDKLFSFSGSARSRSKSNPMPPVGEGSRRLRSKQDDEFEMIGGSQKATSVTDIYRVSEDTDDVSHETGQSQKGVGNGITVQKDWMVYVDEESDQPMADDKGKLRFQAIGVKKLLSFHVHD